MIEAYIGQIKSFGFNFAPPDWLPCEGQLLPIAQYSALYSLLGTTFGGNGTTNFGLPDLRGRTVVGTGQGPGLPNYVLGQAAGAETVTLQTVQLPSHNHGLKASSDSASSTPAGNFFGPVANDQRGFDSTPEASLHPAALSTVGGGSSHNNMPPYLTFNWCICVQGIYPSRS